MSLVYVLLFNARTENEGIHTLQEGDRNKILMFEDKDDATRFALMLEAQDFPPVTVEGMEDRDIIEFCEGADYGYDRIAPGQLAVPPENNVDETDWSESGSYEAKAEKSEKTESEDESDLSDDELERIRQQLEGLL
ncbi:DUF3110 domain-containing protein [[Limnothrix rosea] IAM M-220]|uniref:DUF3110 domain-containing protein n=1 Tax=[Limnothrix rosea] IAM M-220 TaxID=454133 RepID=UPI000964DB33|nr:DUF3110 domain-containing protein [[Limnothrix rosea] IAM M-220]OKH16844.1 hypothetical protein NIES208_11635 [[Limnothrix rosea] IAM M-220]